MKVFRKDDPCSKIDIYNCFFGQGSTPGIDGLQSSDITRARNIIGRNVPRRLIEQGHAVYVMVGGQEHIQLTKEGQNWLLHGALRYLKNNPAKFNSVENPPSRWKRRFANVCSA